MFGPGRAVPLDRNAKARILAYAKAWGARHRQPGQHKGPITRAFLEVLEALLWGFHNARIRLSASRVTKQSPSRPSATGDTVYEGLKVLEWAGVLTWQHRIARIQVHFRSPYAHFTLNYPRQCGFAGTINPGGNGYLRDETGSRRFWPVACGAEWPLEQKIDTEGLAAVRDQLWAEAVVRFRAGEPWHLPPHLEEAQVEFAAERQEDDAREPRIRDFIANRAWVRMDEILGQDCLCVPIERWTRALRMGDRRSEADAQPSKQLSHAREVLHCLPEPPDGLAEFEQHVMASGAPAVVLIGRTLVRGLLRYVRRLERQFNLLPADHRP